MSNTFGLAITAETVRAMGRYDHKDTIDQVDCAREAMRLIHAEDKNLDALAYAWDLKGMYGNGKTSIVLVYNATGDRVTLGDGRDWSGRIYGRQPPRDFQNGQWIAFLHVRSPSNPNELQAARVFRGRNVDGRPREFLVSWAIPLQGSQNNSVSFFRYSFYRILLRYMSICVTMMCIYMCMPGLYRNPRRKRVRRVD
jgi:hypothetical protein